MNEILAVNDELRATFGDRFTDEKVLTISADSDKGLIADLSDELRERIAQVLEQIAQEVPPDFGFELFLGEPEPLVEIKFDDGPATWAGSLVTPIPWLSVTDQFREYDWAGTRAMALSGAAVFNAIVEHSPEAPENIPATAELQAKFKKLTDAFHKAPLDPGKVHVFQWDDMRGLHGETFESKESFVWELPNLMTCGYQVIAVLINGKPLSARQIDRMKRAALNELKDMPISYAKASGRLFPPTILEDEA